MKLFVAACHLLSDPSSTRSASLNGSSLSDCKEGSVVLHPGRVEGLNTEVANLLVGRMVGR